jgi:hypothetical protein
VRKTTDGFLRFRILYAVRSVHESGAHTFSARHRPAAAVSLAGYGFDTDPPNVALVVREPSGATDTVVAVMTRPKVTATGVFTARLRVLSMDQAQAVGSHLAGHAGRHDMKVPTRFTAAALFIDDVTGTVVNGCLIQPSTQDRFAPDRFAPGHGTPKLPVITGSRCTVY